MKKVIYPVDERCQCGTKRSEHTDRQLTEGLDAVGHGGNPSVSCVKFTWVAYVYADGVDSLAAQRVGS